MIELSVDWHLQEGGRRHNRTVSRLASAGGCRYNRMSVDWHLQEDVGMIELSVEVYTREETTQDVNHTQTAKFFHCYW